MSRIPLEEFFRKPERTSLRLSPSGRHLAFMAPHERRMNVWVRDLASDAVTRVTDETERDVGGFMWANDDRLLYVADRGGDENYRIFGVRRDGSDDRCYTPFENVKCGIVDDLEDDDRHVLFQMNDRDARVFDVHKLDLDTGEAVSHAINPGNVQSWIPDHDGRIRLATTTDGVNTSLLYRETEDDAWKTIATYDFRESVRPIRFTFDNRAIWVASNVGRDKSAIYRFDLETGEPGELVFEHPEVDVSGLLTSRNRKVVTGVAFHTDKPELVFFDEDRRAMQAFLDERLPGRVNRPVSYSRDEARYVVHSGDDRDRGAYWLLDWPARELTKLYDVSPWLDREALVHVEPIRYVARDGLEIPGYLTVPKGVERRCLPLVVHPHGGPWHRDGWGFDPELQFLANRGYAVLQMNFRGSTGYGRTFLEAGFGEWGLAMQDDVTDGVKWAIERGIADPDRIAIYGGSYGGYATLAGLTKTPELYACGISYVGVSNLFTWFEAIPPYWKPYLEMMHVMVGHPERDAERLRATSPFFRAEAIRCPLLVVQGANDPRVRKEESDQIVEAARARGLDVEYIVKEDEGHGFVKEENRFEFYRALEAFLDRHLGPVRDAR